MEDQHDVLDGGDLNAQFTFDCHLIVLKYDGDRQEERYEPVKCIPMGAGTKYILADGTYFILLPRTNTIIFSAPRSPRLVYTIGTSYLAAKDGEE